MSQPGTGRWFLGCGSVTLIVCILISHKQHTIKCQSPQSFRPIKPVAHHQQQVNHFKSPSASQLATSFQLQQRHPAGPQLAGSHYHSSSNNQQSVISYQPMVQPVAGLSPWSPNILRGPPKLSALSNNGPSGTRHHRQLSLGQQHQVKHQQAQQQQQQRQQQVPTITNSLLNNAPPRQDAATVQMATERRVSSSQQLVTDNIGPVLPGTGQQSSKINQQPREAVNEQLVPTRLMSSMANQQDQQEQQPHHWHHDQNGKLLICYYATKQTAPYWPKNSREFIVPASRLDEAASEFLKMRSEPPPAGGSQQFFSSSPFAASSSGHNFNRQQQQQQQQQLGSFVQNLPANSLSLQGLNIAQQQQQATPTVSHVGGDGHHQRRSIFAGGRRLVVVAPEFVPFNQSKLMMPHNRQQQQQQQQNNEIAVDQPDSLAHMFFMANHNRHNTIADRQDNGATITSVALSTSPTATTTTSNTNTMITNKSNAKLQLGAPTQQQLVEFGGVPNNNEQQLQNQQDTNMMTHNTGGFVVFNNNKSKQDLTNNNDNHQRIINTGGGGGGLGHGSYEAATGGNRLAQSQTSIDHLQLGQSVGQQQQAAGAGISAPISRLPNRNTGANQQNNDRSSAPSSSANVNNRDHPERAAKARHELLLSPSMGRAFMLGSTSTTSSFSSSSLAPDSSSIVVPSSLNYEDKPPPDYRPLFGGSSGGGQPTLNNEQSATSNYYYYYNLPNSNQLSQQTKSGSTTTTNEAGPSSAMMPVTTAIIGNGRPTGLDQQQHHELSGTTLAGFNSHGGGPALQRANSLVQQTPADQNDLLQPAMFTSSSPLPSSSSSSSSSPQPAAASSPTSYLINTPTHQGSHNLALDALIVSNNNNNQAPSSLTSTSTTASTSQRQRYSSSSSTTPNNQQQVNSSPKSDYLFKLSGSSSLAPPASEDIVSPSSMLSIKSTTPSLIVQSSSSSPLGAFSQRPPNSSASSSATGDTAGVSSSGLQSKVDDSSSNNRNQQQQQLHNHHHGQHQHHGGKQTVGLGGNSLSAALVSSPLSTMFDVFGAASQYLMRFKPSSLISPASFAAFNNIGAGVGGSGDHTANSHGSNKLRENSSSLGSLVSLTSFTGQGGQHHNSHNQKHQSVILGDHKARPSSSPAARANNSSSSHPHAHQVAGGFLSRLSLQQGAQRRDDICGRTIQTPERRIIGGEGAKYGEFPYQVHIKIAKHQCGGALIDRQSIVTAAHCVYHFITRAPVSKLQIVIGAYDIEDEQYQELPPQHFKVNKVKLHPNFRFSASHPDRYDIAILKLDKPVKYTDNVLPVCLPGKDLKYENMVGTVTGFGKTDPSLSNRYGTRLLQKVDVPIIENGECERWHRTRGIDLKIFPEMMCAGYEDGLKDACVGDSGGPLVVKTPIVVKGPDGGDLHSFRWTLAGITSAGFGCAQSRQPGIYHRVSHTVDWILDNLD